MKKISILSLLLLLCVAVVSAQQKQAEIKFDKVLYDFGHFSENEPIQKCSFTFTNVGNSPLVINQVVASCGCTIPQYTKAPIAPGKKGTITITYNGKGKFAGHFKKTITIRTNGVTEMTRLYIEGFMDEVK